MADEVEQGERNGLSRRQMIKASAVAGAAAWTAPVIIDSLASPAAAASNCTGTSVTMSWIYILFQRPAASGGGIFVTGFSTGDTACNSGGKNNGGTRCNTQSVSGSKWPACTNATGYTITLNDFSANPPSPAANDITYNASGSCGAPQSNAWTFMNAAAGCGTWIQFSGGQINAIGGATILAAMGFGGGELIPACTSSVGPNNSVCGIEGV
jgi:hypothetical protein